MGTLSRVADDREELLKIFPVDDDSRFRMNYRKVEDPRVFLAATDEALLAERGGILDEHPERHAGLLPEGEQHFANFAAYVAAHGGIDGEVLAAIRSAPDPTSAIMELARRIEPDFTIMRVTRDRMIRLVGACICFPSSWSPEKKLGMELKDIHEIVPGLNAVLGSKIYATLANMKPGPVGMRADWSMKASTDLNHHPLRNIPLPDASATLESSFVRIERQMMVGLPETADATTGIAFCIRYALYRVADMAADPELREGLLRTLRTMPDAVLDYKNLTDARGPLVEQLEQA